MSLGGVWNVLTRRKILDERDQNENSRLSRCLGTWDLTFLGVGSTLGVGVYVLAGHVARESAGPSVILSFLIAAVVSVFAGLCYAEFGARVPQAGSAYIYSYVCVGEFIAFVIGWNLILEYVIGSASVCRGISIYLDSLLNNTMKDTFIEIVPINIGFLSSYFDLLAFALAFVFGVLLAFGMKKSAMFNNIFTVLNIGIVLFVIVIGAFKADINNWKILPENIPPELGGGTGGFFPYGFSGMMKGAATCFYGFVGFDCIATTGEEVKNPKKAIPMAIIISLAVIFLSYFGISSIITLMWPYYLQDANSPIPYIFHEIGWEWAKWIVAIGGMFGLFASLLGSMFPLPRILYAMASDGLIFRIFGKVSNRFKTPVIGTIFAALLTGTLAGLFELGHLINMMSIGTLMAYTIVAACILLLRFRFNKYVVCVNVEKTSLLSTSVHETDQECAIRDSPVYEIKQDLFAPKLGSFESLDTLSYTKFKDANNFKTIVNQLLNVDSSPEPTPISSKIVGTLILIYCLSCIGFSLCLIYSIDELINQTVWAVTITSILGFVMLLCMFLIFIQPKARAEIYFQVPLVPLIPCLSIFANIYLMLMLDVYTWIRFGIWMALGLPVYLISLYVYDRGSNYVMYTQKSSINGHMSGNLNYAFENIVECQERSVAFVPSEKIMKRKVDMSENESLSVTLPSLELNTVNSNKYTSDEEMEQNIPDQNYPVHHVNVEVISENTEETQESESLSDAYREIKIIELLDQVLQEEDDLNPMSVEEELEEMESIVPKPEPFFNTETSNSFEPVPFLNPSESKSSEDSTPNVLSEVNDQISVQNENGGGIRENGENFSSKIPHNELLSVDSNENVPEKNEPAVVIPVPPPIDESYFKNSGKYVKSKPSTPKILKTEISILSETDPKAVDSSSQLQFGTERQNSFMKKLNTLLKTPNATKSTKLEAYRRSQSTGALEMQTKEPDTNNLDDKIILNDSPNVVSDENKEPDEKYQTEENSVTIEMSRSDLKQKLENIFATTPKMAHPILHQHEKNDSDKSSTKQIELQDEDIMIKPKTKENYTNTMKLQRARFGNVLKSIQETHSRRESVISQTKDDSSKRNSINLSVTNTASNV